MSFLNELHQRINQVNSQVGWPALIDTVRHDKLAEAMANATFVRLSDLDHNPDAQGFAMKTVHAYRDSLHRCSTTPDIANGGLLLLFGYDPTIPVPINEIAAWESFAQKHLSDNYTTCDADITFACDPQAATEIMAVKVGEFICVYKVCQQCRAYFNDTAEVRENFGRNRYSDFWDRR